jgi:hypothetical protein
MEGNKAEWQVRLVEGVNGGKAVRFLAPHRQGLIEIPEEVLLRALKLLATDRQEPIAP